MYYFNQCIYQFVLALIIVFCATVLNAAEFYVDPVNGSMSNDGSQAHPWSTMQEVWSTGKIHTKKWVRPLTDPLKMVDVNPSGPVKPGDTIYLMSGYHGFLSVNGAVNDDWIYIKAYPGETPKFRRIYLRTVSKWSFDGISISLSYSGDAYAAGSTTMFSVEHYDTEGPGSHITIKNSEIFSAVLDPAWTAQNWLDIVASGISVLKAPYSIVDNVDMSVINFGVMFTRSDFCELRNSNISEIRGDGVRNTQGDYVKVEDNTIKNSYFINDNHNDMIQVSVDKTVVPSPPVIGMEIRRNILIGNEDEHQPFISGVQGIGMFDGFYEDCMIENNLLVVHTNHGISLYGARNCIVRNNTVTMHWTVAETLKAPINIVAHKDGTPGSGNIIINNFATTVYAGTNNSGGVVTNSNNITGFTPADHFTNPTNFDYSLKSTSAAINAGSTLSAPTTDILKRSRDHAPDIGAYEFLKLPAPQGFNFLPIQN